jgi:RNA polymerase sigma factor (sigma-70 family)
MINRQEREEFGRMYDEHVWSVYGFLGYRLNSRADAEDLTQQTFERALRAWPRFDERKGSAGAWLLSIARNLLIDHYRRDRSGQHDSINDSERGLELSRVGEPEPELGISAELASALGLLPERQREVIALRYGGDLTGPEIAELTGLTLANVHQLLSRALRRLRGELGGERAAPSDPQSTD